MSNRCTIFQDQSVQVGFTEVWSMLAIIQFILSKFLGKWGVF